MRPTAAALALALLGAACGRSSPADEVRATLRGFESATARRDYQQLCDRYLAPSLVQAVEQAGLPCEVALRPELSRTRRPRLEVRSVRIRGDRALAQVHSSAANQPPSDDTIELVRRDGRWRIASLAVTGPQPPPAP